ncbi:uncharacterized protein LOC116121337 isoform X2 [Pistacia vera]|uniref:uncharacterized protein LOC116121337 isoform X2 n=1 Tax=Pistacia vera TaxID=55513 RepID=UPI001263C7A3|nr:uncharacterized protein LOC116121337 isoform X2 [Pistacia vera]
MVMVSSRFSSLALALFIFLSTLVSSELLLEEGYTVTTVIDGHHLKINPHSVIPRPGSSDLILLDSANSLFYTFSFPLSQENVMRRLSGNGAGYQDGEPGSAQFKKPRSFAVDLKGNVYVADKSNYVIRKITDSGVTTIAGGYSKKTGNDDGPAQNATFSYDFELTFVPGICALLISDHGNQLVRQINLKAEDCSRSSHSGAATVWVLGMGLSCLIGLVIGIVVRPYIISHEALNLLLLNMTWRDYQINLVKQVQILCFGIRSVVASSTVYALLRRIFWLSISYISLMFRINNLESKTSDKVVYLPKTSNTGVSLLDCNDLGSCADQLKDLISCDGNLDLLTEDMLKQGNEKEGTTDVLSVNHGKLDDMIKANIMGFSREAEDSTPVLGSSIGSSGLVKRNK